MHIVYTGGTVKKAQTKALITHSFSLYLIVSAIEIFKSAQFLILSCAHGQWRGGRGVALKFVIANVEYCTKYVKSSLSTNSKIFKDIVILAFVLLFN